MARVKYMNKEQKKQYNLSQYPNFSVTGSIYGMKKLYYGMDALLVRCGSWIYHVSESVYNAVHQEDINEKTNQVHQNLE